MSKVFLCPLENINCSDISKPPDGMPISFRLLSWRKSEHAVKFHFGMRPIVVKLEKYFFFVLIAQALDRFSNDDAVISNSTVTLSPTFAFIQDVDVVL